MFKLLHKVNIMLSSRKLFLKYLLVFLLEQRVDNFSLIIIINKIKIIT